MRFTIFVHQSKLTKYLLLIYNMIVLKESMISFVSCIPFVFLFLFVFFSGWIYDLSESYQLSFLLSGGLCVFSCCILFIVPIFKQNNERKNVTKSHKTNKLIDEQDLHRCPTDDPLTSWRSFEDHESYRVQGWKNLYQEARETDV